MTRICAETHFPRSLLLNRSNALCSPEDWAGLESDACGPFEGHDFLSEEMAARPSWRQAQVTDGLKGFRKLSVKWRPSFGIAMETDGTIASPWSGLHFLVLSGHVCVCQWDMGQMVGYLYPDCCQENLHPFGNKKGVLLVRFDRELGISAITPSATVSPL